MVDGIHKVKKGDSPWKVAQQSLKAQGKKVSNAEILKETYDRTYKEYRNSIEAIVLFVQYVSQEPNTLKKVEAAIKFLTSKLVG
jgi:hypothetical protein